MQVSISSTTASPFSANVVLPLLRLVLDLGGRLLVGFHKKDWSRSLDELLAEGLVHRCFCVYKKNRFGDVPNKGIAFSPLFSPKDWGFNGKKELDALYIPEVYLEKKGE